MTRDAPICGIKGSPDPAARAHPQDFVVQLINETPFEVAWQTWRSDPKRCSLTVVVKGSFDLVAHGPCPISSSQVPIRGGEHFEGDPEQSQQSPNDLVPLKPKGECMLIGSLRTPGGEPRRSLRAAFQVGELGKQLRVAGDRFWSGGSPSEAAPFTEMPLRWERCFGGPGHEANPVGVGLQEVEIQGARRLPLPNVEDGLSPLRSPRDRPRPAGTGPISLTWPARLRMAGTYDERWRRERWPYFAEDMRWELWNEAPPELRLPQGYFRGDERLQLIQCIPSQPQIDCALPGLRAQAFLSEEGRPGLREVGLRLDTVVLDLDEAKALCSWRGVAEVRDESLAGIEQLFVVHVPAHERRTASSYDLWLSKALKAREEAEQIEEPDDQATRSWATRQWQREAAERLEGWRSALAAELAAKEKEERAQADKKGELKKEELRHQWAHLDQAVTLADFGEVPTSFLEIDEDSTTAFRAPGSRSLGEEEARRLEAELLHEERDRLGQERRAKVVEALAAGRSCAGWDLAGADLSGLSAEGADFSGAILKGANLSRSYFEKGRFEGALLVETELSYARFAGCTFEGADLSGSRVEEAHFVDCLLRGADASGCYMAGARFLRVKAEGAGLEQSVVAGAHFDDCDLSRARMSGAVLDAARFARSSLADARLEGGVSGRGVLLDGCDLRKLRASEGADLSFASLRNVRADEALLSEAKLEKADLSGADLRGADLRHALLKEAKLPQAMLREARLDAAILVSAVLTGSDLYGARLEGADLRFADLRHSNLFRAELWQARLEGARLEGAELGGTHLAGEKRA